LKRALVWAWAALLCAVLFAQTWVRASRPDGIDLTSYLLSAEALLHGSSPYVLATPFPYLYPATLAFLLIPLAILPPVVALTLWFALGVAAGTWSVHRVLTAARPDLTQRPDDVALLLAAFFTFFFAIVQSNLRNGQVNFLVLALCVGAAGLGAAPAAGQGRRRSFSLTGIAAPRRLSATWWALAVSIKLVPLALMPFFALRRRWPWLVSSVVMIGVFCLLPVVVLGTGVFDVYKQYWRVFLASSFSSNVQALDFSLAGTIALVTRAPSTPMLRLSAAAVVVGWIVPTDVRRLRAERVRPLGMYLLAIPLVSPRSEVHHLAFMLPAAAIVAGEWWRPVTAGPRMRLAAAAAAGLYLAATTVPRLNGPLYCGALIALGAALMNVSPPEEAGSGRTAAP
jgi:hypothetical protein